MRKASRYNKFLVASAAAITAAAPVPVLAQIQTFQFDIGAQPLDSALRAFARASRQQILFEGSLVRGKQSTTLLGTYAVDAGLERLLIGTGLRAQLGKRGAYVIKRADVSSGKEAAGSNAANSGRMVLDDQIPQDIVVTGTNIRGSRIAAPLMTIADEEIETGGFASVEEVFRSIPQNFSGTTPGGVFASEGGSMLAQTNNMSRASSIDLRGLGPQSTLVLFNGQRLASSNSGQVVDVAAIPLSVVDRIEIVTGGRSAIYGADAVAGVVNLITKRKLDGAATQIQLGLPTESGGGRRVRVSQAAGIDRSRGGFLFAYDYQNEDAVDAVQRGLTTDVDANGGVPLELEVQPNASRHSVFTAGKFELAPGIELYGHGLYSGAKTQGLSRELLPGALNESFVRSSNRSDRFNISIGGRADLSEDWSIEIVTGFGHSSEKLMSDSFTELFIPDFGLLSYEINREFFQRDTVVDGSLTIAGEFDLSTAIRPRLAAGASARHQRFNQVDDGLSPLRRSVYAVYGEFIVPLGRRLPELSAAGRYDSYSDFGGVLNPQVGALWQLSPWLRLRGTYGKSYRAPALSESLAGNILEIAYTPDPLSPSGVSPTLTRSGVSTLEAEKASTWTAGFDAEFGSQFRIAASYFDIHYRDRIDVPAFGADTALFLQRPGFARLIQRSPVQDELANWVAEADFLYDQTRQFDPNQNLLDVFPGLVVFDNRRTNLSEERVNGFDVSMNYIQQIGKGQLTLGANTTLSLTHKRKVTQESPAFSIQNEVGKPVDFRVRANAGWTQGPYGAYLFYNYTDGYRNPFVTPDGQINSWSTFDLTASIDGSKLAADNILNKLRFSVTVQNALGTSPPLYRSSSRGIKYDAANASAVGRVISFTATANW